DAGLRRSRGTSPPAGAASASITYVGPAGYGFGSGRRRRDRADGGPPHHLRGRAVRSGRDGARTRPGRRDPDLPDRAGIGRDHDLGPAADWESLLELLSHAVLRPRFDPEDIERVQRQLRESQLRELTQPAHRAERELFRAIFPMGHPYRETGWGSARSVGGINRGRLVRFHSEHYTAEGGVLVATIPAPLKRLERASARWRSHFARARAPSSLRPRPVLGRRVVRQIEMAGRSQTEVHVGGPSIARSREEFP
ncbi:hypothetical protein B1B_03619, partial [mine drainage metagenome]